VGNFTNDAWDFPPDYDNRTTWLLKNNDIFHLARSLQWMLRAQSGAQKRELVKMTFSFLDTRQLAVSLAGAFITSLLFVSAATSLPIA
jgi:hypothetical protein